MRRRQADVRDLAALTEAVDRGVAELGRLDIVLANAGISSMAPKLEMDEATWNERIDINLTGQWKTVKAAVPHIIQGGLGGSVVIISSLAAITTNENTTDYTAAKHGLIGLMRVLAKELAPHSIRVNTLRRLRRGGADAEQAADRRGRAVEHLQRRALPGQRLRPAIPVDAGHLILTGINPAR